jgi:membrane dipeptidase
MVAEASSFRQAVGYFVKNVDKYAAEVAGIDHVGLGSDFGGRGGPIGLETAEGFSLITYHLLKRGYKAEDIKKIMGGNVVRVFEEVRKFSSTL